ncbi:membrane protein [Rhodococcus erythropolis R138]|uniref:GAP family protein n=1 Tax=Rhodococcus erythropolis TaxID=1833 RepID=UPI00049265A0|nr:GAP family protein [Rhodococcus erythropolis]ALU71367.1 membrane protein [Rhodococcus erythropolis R138]
MGSVIGDLLPIAVGVAVSPVAVIATILMLLSKRAGSTSIGFALGCLLGIFIATVLFVTLSSALSTSDNGPSATVSWIKLALGVLLLAFGVKQWRGRSGEHETPKWMQAIDEMTAVKGLGLGFALAAINPKNLLMCIAAGVSIGSASLATSGVIASVLVFTIIASSTVAIPVIGYLVSADRLREPLAKLKVWLQDNNTTVMSVLILVVGVVLIGKGIGGIF